MMYVQLRELSLELWWIYSSDSECVVKRQFGIEDQAKELDLLYHWNRHTIQEKLRVEVMFT